jgi:hypothetical protein
MKQHVLCVVGLVVLLVMKVWFVRMSCAVSELLWFCSEGDTSRRYLGIKDWSSGERMELEAGTGPFEGLQYEKIVVGSGGVVGLRR